MIRPVDVPELRAALVGQREYLGAAALALYDESPTFQVVSVSPGSNPDDIPLPDLEHIADGMTRAIRRADLFHVSESMTGLAAAAAATLPEFVSDRADFPSDCGFVVFEGGFEVPWDDGTTRRILAAAWETSQDAVGLGFFTDLSWIGRGSDVNAAALAERVAQRSGPCAVWFKELVTLTLPFLSKAGRSESGASPSPALEMAFSIFRSVALLMQQPLADVADTAPDRMVRKRLKRVGHAASNVRVIDLRRPARGEGASGDNSREYQHQWIVRGHWRQQWYPTREVHRPVWIAPHIKGPEGAPLLGGEKVHVLRDQGDRA